MRTIFFLIFYYKTHFNLFKTRFTSLKVIEIIIFVKEIIKKNKEIINNTKEIIIFGKVIIKKHKGIINNTKGIIIFSKGIIKKNKGIITYHLFCYICIKNQMLRKKKHASISIPQSAVVLHLTPIMAARNIKNKHGYLVTMGINNVTAQKMLKGTSVQVNYDQLTKLCLTLNCTPNDLFALRDLVPPENHQLHKLQPLSQEAVNPASFFEGKSLDEIRALQVKLGMEDDL